MKRACSRVASRPTSTTSRPVAKGSRMPAWPTLASRPRRTRATTSCEVIPAGLSTSRTPAPGSALLEVGTERLYDLLVGEIGAEAGGAAVAATSVAARDLGHVDVAVGRAQAHLARRPRRLPTVADDGGHQRALERADEVDDPLAQQLRRTGLGVVGVGEVGERQAA